ncbi:hypothetical protein MMC18_004323 [Xylographa bjoerkii]|nr:hypothetical protein [Xylographa bjoerkii]
MDQISHFYLDGSDLFCPSHSCIVENSDVDEDEGGCVHTDGSGLVVSVKMIVHKTPLTFSATSASACSIVRIVLLDIVEDPVDITWNIIPVQVWALFEMNLSILAANMPVLLPLYRFLHQKVPEGVGYLRTYLRKSSSYTANDKAPTSDQDTLRATDSFSRLHQANIRKTVDYTVDYDRNSSKHGAGSTELQRADLWV